VGSKPPQLLAPTDDLSPFLSSASPPIHLYILQRRVFIVDTANLVVRRPASNEPMVNPEARKQVAHRTNTTVDNVGRAGHSRLLIVQAEADQPRDDCDPNYPDQSTSAQDMPNRGSPLSAFLKCSPDARYRGCNHQNTSNLQQPNV
jgi:hypothetical protein